MSPWWSWVLTIIGVTGLYFAGKKVWWAWLIGLGAQVLWLAYAVATEQYGFIVSAFAYGWVYARNARLWWLSHSEERRGHVRPEPARGVPARSDHGDESRLGEPAGRD